jgi:hypothetical protein
MPCGNTLERVYESMRWAWRASVVCAALAGCATRGDKASVSVVRSLAPVAPGEAVQIDSILLERPVGDKYLDRDLWADARPVGAPEVRALWAENGLRAGVLVGNLPPRFQALLDTETDALNGRRLTLAARDDRVLPTSGPHERCAFAVRATFAEPRAEVAFKQARCGVLVRPEPAGRGRVKLSCEPQIQHGERRDVIRASGDVTGFVKSDEVPLVRHPTLALDVRLEPDEYLLIGWDAGQPDTLGEALFAVEARDAPRQRVLVVRARQTNPGAPTDLPALGPTRHFSVAAEAARPTK